jgi:hypothetical protein
MPPRFRLRAGNETSLPADACASETERPDSTRQYFAMTDRGDYLESIEEIPEPHAFTAHMRIAGEQHLCHRKLVAGAVLLDMNLDRRMADNLRQAIEGDGDRIADFHLWRLGPGHLGAIVCVGTRESCRAKLARFRSLSHLTVEVR